MPEIPLRACSVIQICGSQRIKTLEQERRVDADAAATFPSPKHLAAKLTPNVRRQDHAAWTR
jgi:hypothetical protein